LEAGLIVERNLDRFDTTCLTWKHPNLSPERLSRLLYECYSKFNTVGHSLRNIRNKNRKNGRGSFKEKLGSLAMSSFIRYCSWRQTHPMSGGVIRAKVDHVRNYTEFRKRVFDVDLAPLPKSLQLHHPHPKSDSLTGALNEIDSSQSAQVPG
jgi:hypothetical protein